MPDPLSITAGVVALLRVTWTVATELKKFQDEVSVVKESVSGLQRDVDGLTRVLESMRDTFANITAEHGTGIVAAHWSNIAKSVVDGHDLLLQLHDEVQKIDKTTNFLDGPRKQLRLNLAEDKISGFRVHIQAYRDALQLSMQTIILSNQMSQQNSTDLIIPNLSTLQTDVRRLAMDFNQKIDSLQAMVLSQQDQVKLTAMDNLRNCVRSSASIMSSASTAMASQRGAQPPNVAVPGSDFGDCFPMDGIALNRWIDSDTVYEYDVTTSNAPPQSVADVPIIGDSDPSAASDSDSDFESDITTALLESGKSRRASGDLKAAEKLLRNCLSRATPAQSKRTKKQTTQYLEIITLLIALYTQQKRWSEAQEMLTLKMVATERLVGNKDVDFLGDVVLLARLAQSAGDIVGAQLHTRRALKGFRRAGITAIPQQRSCLVLLIELCNENHDTDDEEAFEVMLAMISEEHYSAVSLASQCGSSWSDESHATEALPSAPLQSTDAFVQHKTFSGQESEVSVVSAAAEDLSRLALPFADVDERDLDDWSASSDPGTNLDRLPGKSASSSHMAPLPAFNSTSIYSIHSREHGPSKVAHIDQPSPQHALNDLASSEVVPPLPHSNSHRVASQPPSDEYDGRSAAQAIPQHEKSTIAAGDVSAAPEPAATLHPASSQRSSTQSSTPSRTYSTTLLPTSSDAGTEATALSVARTSWITASSYSPIWDSREHRQRQRSLKYLNGIIAGRNDDPVKDWAFAATAVLVHLGRSEPADAGVYAAMGAVFTDWPTNSYLTDPFLYATARTVVTQLLQRHGSRLWGNTDDGTPSVGADEDLRASLGSSPSELESLLDRTVPSWRTWTELVKPDCSYPTFVFSPPDVIHVNNNNAHSQTGISILRATPAEPLLEPQPVDGAADSQSLQTNVDPAFRSFGSSVESLSKRERKAVLVGDGVCGKTALLRALTGRTFFTDYIPAKIFQTFVANIEIDGMSTDLALWDTPGQEDYDRRRGSVYSDAHVVLMCFSIDDPDSLDNIHAFWLPEVSDSCAGVPIVLVGTKSDLRDDGAIHPVTYEEALHAQIKIGAKAYMECSAKLGDGVAEVFETAVRCALEKSVKAKRRRSLLRMFGMSRD
ncbi:hypothetical protein Q7P36_006399 [Cladosporium allicinum]